MDKEKGERSFTVVASSFDKNQDQVPSRYVSRSPYSAARKAARVLFENHPNMGSVVRLKLRETTRGSKGKEYEYQAKFNKVDKQIEVGGRQITIKAHIDLHSIGHQDKRLHTP